ncbi:MAG TPA: hypothetical protein VK766_06690, partial [Cytophagaceae bacterium]|nr:hypothetical protein [Cytophagaceae bacterium]
MYLRYQENDSIDIMDHLSFFPFHNKFIRFSYNGQEMQGVVIDYIPYNKKEFSTQYIFIEKKDMKLWKEASEKHDKTVMEALESKIDI